MTPGSELCMKINMLSPVRWLRHVLHTLAYNLANFMRTLALPQEVKQWSLVTDDVAQQARQDRRQGGAPRPVRDLPACGSGGPEGAVHRDPAADRATASQTGTDMTRSRVTDDPLRQRTRRELRLEARLRRSSATDTSALTGPRLKNPAKPPKIARELKADRRGSTVFDLEGRHLGYVG